MCKGVRVARHVPHNGDIKTGTKQTAESILLESTQRYASISFRSTINGNVWYLDAKL